MSKTEKMMLMITLILLVVLVPKSLFFDEAKVTGDQLKFKKFTEKLVEDDKGFLIKLHVASYKVVSVKKISDEGVSTVKYYDDQKGEYVEEQIDGKYRAKVREYFLYFLPYKEFRVESQK